MKKKIKDLRDCSVSPVVHYNCNDLRVYTPKLFCIGKGMERAISYSQKHRIPIVIHGKDYEIIEEFRPYSVQGIKGCY